MPRPFDPARFRRVVAGLSLVAAPLCGVAWSWLVPPFTGGMPGEVAFVAAHPGRWAAGTYAGVLFSYLMIPAVLGLLALVRGRGTVLAHAGAALAATGAAFHGSMLGFQLAETQVVQRAADPAQALAIATALYEQPAFTALLIPMMGLFLGLLLLAIALRRAHAAPAWVSVALVVGIAIELAGPPAFKARALFALLLPALGWLGVARLRGATAPAAPMPAGRAAPARRSPASPSATSMAHPG